MNRPKTGAHRPGIAEAAGAEEARVYTCADCSDSTTALLPIQNGFDPQRRDGTNKPLALNY